MKVYIANFGRRNYEWPQCLARNTVATMNDEGVHGYWEAGDREGYINYCVSKIETAAGFIPTRPVASRWFNLMTIVAETHGDVWIHREKDQFWWTISEPEPPSITLQPDPNQIGGSSQVYVCHKPCKPWSNFSRKGNRLEWKALHAKAREFLFTEGTLQQLSAKNAAYALALIEGEDLTPWHSNPEWTRKANAARKGAVTIFSAKQRAVARMASTAIETAARSNGQQELRTVKNKGVCFTRLELEAYLTILVDEQEGLCAITGLPLQFDGECDDPELRCSLDRIDSDGHYEKGNLQVVCQFVNRWKNNSRNEDFRRLIALLRTVA